MEKLKTMISTSNLMTNVLDKFKLQEDEYCENDTFYCKKCKTKRTHNLDTFGYVRTICDCQLIEKIRKEKEEFRQLQIRKFRELQKTTL